MYAYAISASYLDKVPRLIIGNSLTWNRLCVFLSWNLSGKIPRCRYVFCIDLGVVICRTVESVWRDRMVGCIGL
jgi:hypothetical protein